MIKSNLAGRRRNTEQTYKHMQAFIFAAGKGTRLRPLTTYRPKALVEVSGKPLLMHTMEWLKSAGVRHMVINIHHLGEQIVEYVNKNPLSGIRISISDERDHLLDTGGALKKAAPLMDNSQPFFAVNSDVITNLDLNALINYHKKHKPMATMAVKRREASRHLLISRDNKLAGWENTSTGEQIIIKGQQRENLHKTAFSGIQVIEPKIFRYMPQKKAFPVIPWYLSLAQMHPFLTWNHDQTIWFDVGTPEKLCRTQQYLQNREPC